MEKRFRLHHVTMFFVVILHLNQQSDAIPTRENLNGKLQQVSLILTVGTRSNPGRR